LSNGPEPFQKVIVFAFAIGVQQEIQNITISLGRMIFPMTSDQFRAALADLGLSQAGFARLAMVDARTVRRWCDGTRAVPGPVVALLGMMDKQRLTSP
jgi:DNA-binding transcriptional regulator YiaG